jgi:hypothetical protein
MTDILEMALGSLGKIEYHLTKRFAKNSLASMRVWAQAHEFIHLYIYTKKTNYIYVHINLYLYICETHI